MLDHVRDAEDLAPIRHAPRQRTEEVQERFGQHALPPVAVDGGVELAFGDLALVGIPEERHVHECGRIPSEGVVQAHVDRRRRDPLLRAHHVRHAHEVVVHHHGQVVRGIPVRFEQDVVAHFAVLERDLAAEFVANHDRAFRRSLQPHHVPLAGFGAALLLFAGYVPAATVVADRTTEALLLLAHLLELFLGLERPVRMPLVQQPVDVLPVDGKTLGLLVRSVVAADARTLVGLQAEPAHHLEDAALGGGVVPLAVGVFEPEQKLPTVLLGENEVEQADVRGAHVGIPGRRRRDARHDGHGVASSKQAL